MAKRRAPTKVAGNKFICKDGKVRAFKHHDPVNHPSHYTFGKYQVIDVIEDWQLGFHLGNCVKYIARAGRKNDVLEDLKKARWYLDRLIGRIQDNDQLVHPTFVEVEANLVPDADGFVRYNRE